MVFTVVLRKEKKIPTKFESKSIHFIRIFFGLDRLVLNSLVRIYRQPCLILRLIYNSGCIKEF